MTTLIMSKIRAAASSVASLAIVSVSQALHAQSRKRN